LREVEQDFPGRSRRLREGIALLERVLALAPHPSGPMPAGQVTGSFIVPPRSASKEECCQTHVSIVDVARYDLAERVTTLPLADDTCKALIDETATEVITWQGLGADVGQQLKPARLSRVIFVR
jgi:hypothetical protein